MRAIPGPIGHDGCRRHPRSKLLDGDTPAESGADHLVAIGYHGERIAAYLSTLRRVYDAMKRCLGQMAGLLLLLQTRCLDSQRAGVTHDAMREILAEISDRLRALRAPEGA